MDNIPTANIFENLDQSFARNLDLELYYCGTEQCKPGHYFGPGVKDHYKIHFIHSGKGIYVLDGAQYSLYEGQAFLISPNDVVYYEADANDPWRYSWVAFNGINSEKYLKRVGLSAQRPYKSCENPANVDSVIRTLINTSKIPENRDIKLIGLIHLFLAALANESDEVNEPRRTNEYISNAIKYIQMNYSKDMRISDITTYLSLERKYFSRVFKLQTGLSPQEFLLKYRMKMACALLESSSLSIGEIATSVGYGDQLAFSRLFKKHMDVSPSGYRKHPCAMSG